MPDTIWHPMTDIVGIGPSIAADLKKKGFYYAESLLKYTRNNIAASLERIPGLTRKNLVENFCPQARLLRLEGMTPDIAHDLVSAEYDYVFLAHTPTDALRQILLDFGHDIPVEQLLIWQLDASKRRFSSTITVTAGDEQGKSIKDASVYVNDPALTGTGVSWHWKTNEYGQALIEYLMPGVNEIVVVKDEKYSRIPISLGLNQYLSVPFLLNNIAPDGVIYDESIDGPVDEYGAIVRTSIAESDLSDEDVLEVTEVRDQGYRLSKVLRKKKGTNWYYESVRLPISHFATSLQLHDLVKYSSGTFIHIPGSKSSYRNHCRKEFLIRSYTEAIGG